MKNIITRVTRLNFTYHDPIEHQQARWLLIVNLAWMIILILLSPAVVWWLSEASGIDAASLFFPLTLAIAVLNHRLLQRGQLRWARLLVVMNILTATILGIFPDYRIDTPFILVLTVPLTASAVLLRRSGLIGTAVILFVTVTVGGLVQISTDMEPTPVTDGVRTTLVIFVGIFTLNTAILWIFITNMEEVFRQQRHLSRLGETTSQISQMLVSLPTPGEELNRAAEQIRDALGLYHIQIFLADPASGLPTLQASTGFIGRRLMEEDSLLTPDEDSPIYDALRRKDPILIRDTDPEDRRSGFLPATRNQLLLPLRVGDLLPIGVLDLHSTAPDAFSKDMLNTIMVIGSHLAAALYSVQKTTELRAGYQERDQLIDSLETCRRELARANRQLVGATWGTYLEERQDAVPGLDWQRGTITPSQAMSDTLAQTLHDGQPRLETRDGYHVLCVPIRLRDQLLGAVEFRRPGTPGWSPSALELAQAVAERLALSLENARLFEQAQTTAQREQLVSQITTRLQATNDLQSLLSMAAAQFQDALGATHTQVRLGLPPTDLIDAQA